MTSKNVFKENTQNVSLSPNEGKHETIKDVEVRIRKLNIHEIGHLERENRKDLGF